MGWITNSMCIAKELSKFNYRNRCGSHREHVRLVDGRAKCRANRPSALVAVILRGFKAQAEYDKMVNGMGVSVDSMDVGYNVDTETREMVHLPEYESIFDEVTGVQLPPEQVAPARRKEIEFLRSFPVYKHVDAGEAEGHEIIDTRWVDVNKGDQNNMNVRSRLCAKEFKWKNPWLEDTFAGTPPWEGIKMVLSKAMTKSKNPNGGFRKKKVLILDISRAHFHPPAKRRLFIRIPQGDGGGIGLLLRMMYGMRDAAAG